MYYLQKMGTAKCNKFDTKEYKKYQTDKSLIFYCLKCLRETLPTLDLNDYEFNLTMKAINIPEELDVNEIFLNDSQIEIIKQINKAINNGFDNYDKVETDDNKIYPSLTANIIQLITLINKILIRLNISLLFT